MFENEQFVCIGITDGTAADEIYNYLISIYPVLTETIWLYTENEVYFMIKDGVKFDFSLNDLRHHLKGRANVAQVLALQFRHYNR